MNPADLQTESDVKIESVAGNFSAMSSKLVFTLLGSVFNWFFERKVRSWLHISQKYLTCKMWHFLYPPRRTGANIFSVCMTARRVTFKNSNPFMCMKICPWPSVIVRLCFEKLLLFTKVHPTTSRKKFISKILKDQLKVKFNEIQSSYIYNRHFWKLYS